MRKLRHIWIISKHKNYNKLEAKTDKLAEREKQ